MVSARCDWYPKWSYVSPFLILNIVNPGIIRALSHLIHTIILLLPAKKHNLPSITTCRVPLFPILRNCTVLHILVEAPVESLQVQFTYIVHDPKGHPGVEVCLGLVIVHELRKCGVFPSLGDFLGGELYFLGVAAGVLTR